MELLRKELSVFNTVDLLRKIGALNLEPKNAHRVNSLEALAHLVAANAYQPDAPNIKSTRFRSLLHSHFGKDSYFIQYDDPDPQMVIEEVPFLQKPYVSIAGPNGRESGQSPLVIEDIGGT